MRAVFRFALFLMLGMMMLAACAKEEWDAVTLGDSFLARSSIPEQYAAFVAEDLNVKVNLHEAAVNGQEPSVLLENLRTDEELRQMVGEAEVIVFDFSPSWSNSAELKYLVETCGGDDNQDCLREALKKAKADWNEMADILTELTAGRSVIFHTFIFGDWPYDGAYKGKLTPEQRTILTNYFHMLQAFQGADALARNMFVHHIFSEDPGEPPPAEYLQADELHLSDAGSLIVADMLRGTGYKPVWTYLIWGTQLQSLASDFPEEYAAYIEKEYGVTVEILNYAGGSKEGMFLKTLTNKRELIDVVRRAKLMTFDWNPSSIDSAERKFLNGECGGADNQDCLREDYGKARQDWLALLDRMIEIRGGDTSGMRQILMGSWPYRGHYPNVPDEQRDVMIRHFLGMADLLTAEAEARGIEVVQVFPGKYFGNPDEDWFRGVALTEEGDQVVLRALKEIELTK